MNLKLFNFIGVISFLPIWVFRGNLNYIEITFVVVFFFLIPCLIHFYFAKILLIKNEQFGNILLTYYLSLIVVHGIDHNIGLDQLVIIIMDIDGVREDGMLFLNSEKFSIQLNMNQVSIYCLLILSLIIFLILTIK